ncbi:unnamed protein product [Rotaria socialis]|uniref:Replication protein A OB domain-containing protein n=1 Tax=Rotaria socialis TaxID=392032 RepID=A0A820NEG7_9BILA|nr:unnamed protein product [Rotaria socialis]CAF4458139.1 unnamed protein product [Rotaria socialis]CAF4725965.1 unnamed protein product [Rotaria socialis]CAF4742742.1 unnamed protein product [Rotaria socialis]
MIGVLRDVIGIVHLVSDSSIITNAIDKRSYVTRVIKIIDETASVDVTLWEDQARNFNNDSNSVMAFKGIKVHDFMGSRSLTTTQHTHLKIDPFDTERTEHMKHWYHEHAQNSKQYLTSSIL